jgi:hypothetical protein
MDVTCRTYGRGGSYNRVRIETLKGRDPLLDLGMDGRI